MWKFSRNIIFPRWHARKQNFAETTPKNVVYPKVFTTNTSFGSQKESNNESNQKKEHTNKHYQRFWNSAQFQFLLSKSLIETAGWLGTVSVVCFNFHNKYLNTVLQYERNYNRCIFSRNVRAMPRSSAENDLSSSPTSQECTENQPQAENSTALFKESKAIQEISIVSFLDDLRKKANLYSISIMNQSGVAHLDSDVKKSFRCFQEAAHLGSAEGLYNLGLCYELGKGTKINFTRAAFCFRKAAMKGHALASFNLAIYFMKGLGSLPVDRETARLLLKEAANQGVPEAQLYLGIEYLQEQKWSNAYEMFNDLAKRDLPDGKYYLALCFEHGWGVDKNEKIASEIFSQMAALGHSKSILQLSRYYEEGLGGCNSDLDLALALCQIPADQGDEEGMDALSRLKLKKENLKKLDLFKLKMKTGRTPIHASSSDSDLNGHPNSKTVPLTSSYLDLVNPFSSMKIRQDTKPEFYLDDDEMNNSLSTSFLHCFQLKVLPVMLAKT